MNARESRRPLDGAVNPNAETASQQGPVADDEARRQERIAVAAYYNAERRGFKAGGEQDDWLEAEKEISRQEQAAGNRSARPASSVQPGDADRMTPGAALPSGPAGDPLPPKDKGTRKPERRTRAR